MNKWNEAIIKLNKLICKRFQQNKRHYIETSVNLIAQDDLINLKAWLKKDIYVKKNNYKEIALPFKKLDVIDLPAGFILDKFGLLI